MHNRFEADRPPSSTVAPALAALLTCLAGSAWAADVRTDCKLIENDAARLTCYDRFSGRIAGEKSVSPASAAAAPTQTPGSGLKSPDSFTDARSAGGLTMSKTWELDAAEKRGTFKLVPHKLNYLLPVRYSTSTNTMPSSPAPGRSVNVELPLQPTEAKFQFSFKVKAWENIFGDNGDLWLGYTQQSNWQVYNNNKGVSAAFRESNYEPEAILSFRTDRDVLGWHWRMLNIGFVHQSNGHALPLSRSWNRLYAQFGLERRNFSILARPWVRVPESAARDDNPDIRDYMGSGDLRAIYQRSGQVFSALGRYSASGRHGFVQFEWAFPISGALRGYVQATSGYGESLIDYNHSQTTIGVGLLLLPWQ